MTEHRHEEDMPCPGDAHMCPYTARAADAAVKKVFAILGVDIDRPESVEEFREDLRFGKRMRKAADYGLLAIVGLVVIGFGSALWAGIAAKISGGGH